MMIRSVSFLAMSAVLGPFLASAQQGSVPAPKAAPVPAAPKPAAAKPVEAVLVLLADADCEFRIDGGEPTRMKADEVRRVTISLGQHIVLATSIEDKDVAWRNVIDVTGADQKATVLELRKQLDERQAAAKKVLEDQRLAAEKKAEQERLAAARAEAERRAREERAAAQRQEEERRKQEELNRTVWTDPATGLMWAKQDSGQDVDWFQANNYCWDLKLAGFNDWRTPELEDLQALYDKSVDVSGFHIKGGIQLAGAIWSLYGAEEWTVRFDVGRRYSSRGGRANVLCMRRSGNETRAPQEALTKDADLNGFPLRRRAIVTTARWYNVNVYCVH